MPFGAFAILSLFYCFVGLRVVRDLIRRRRETFDRRFTPEDRALVGQAAFFVLIPISVALHELGHATIVRVFGGEVRGFGYYFFAGYVEHVGRYTDAERILIALAGPLVNVLLFAAAVGAVLWRRPPMRAAFNELLLQFAIINLINALVFYPLLDLATGMAGGDWSHMYFGGVPPLSLAIMAGHVGVLALAWWLWNDPGMRTRFNTLTGLPPEAERSVLGGLRHSPRRPAVPADATPEERLLRAAGGRVAGGWPAPVQVTVQRRAGGSLLLLTWEEGGLARGVFAGPEPGGGLALSGVVVDPAAPQAPGPGAARPNRIALLPGAPTEDQLTLALRLAMEEVATWAPGTTAGVWG